jgi:hypothetical protein
LHEQDAFLSPPSFDGFDGGAGARYQARREVTSFGIRPGSRNPPRWCPTASARLPAARHWRAQCLAIAKDFDHVIINTSTPSLKNDCKVAEAIKAQKARTTENRFCRRARGMVLPTETLKASGRLIGSGARNLISPARKWPRTATYPPLPAFPIVTGTAKSNTTPSAR